MTAIETDRLILRSFRDEDAADVFEYLKAPMVNCFACMKVHSMEEAQKAVMERAEDAEYTLAIALRDTGKVIGEIDVFPDASMISGIRSRTSLLYTLDIANHFLFFQYSISKAIKSIVALWNSLR